MKRESDWNLEWRDALTQWRLLVLCQSLFPCWCVPPRYQDSRRFKTCLLIITIEWFTLRFNTTEVQVSNLDSKNCVLLSTVAGLLVVAALLTLSLRQCCRLQFWLNSALDLVFGSGLLIRKQTISLLSVEKTELLFKLMKVLSHPGHGNSKCCIVGNWTCFSSDSSETSPVAYDTALRVFIQGLANKSR